ncbi:hypothetical protein [Pseudomonas sp. S3E17]|uniref:hypothetical protein n=1 Tax=Pseudomonas sp. S3E17 TaxID=2817893 RepID=UPI00209F05E1|nr:hypothetical protein [Pseudomonas sp. S3E17]MCP1463297.1 protein-S-isoprenylcysteine O-methyltransferase Ste14 [Pseudomonas sp. S3E17]
MDFQVWQAVVVPLAIALLTLFVTWRHNTASISHQRTQRLRDLVHSGSWRTVHPMVLVMDVREAFSQRINLDPRALRLALDYQDHAFAALRYYLVARIFVNISEDGRRFQRMAHGNSEKTYGHWPIYIALSGLVPYSALMITFFYLADQGRFEAVFAILGAILGLLFTTWLAFGMNTANRLFKLRPVQIQHEGTAPHKPDVSVDGQEKGSVISDAENIPAI